MLWTVSWSSIQKPSSVPFPDVLVRDALGKLGIPFCRCHRDVAQKIFITSANKDGKSEDDGKRQQHGGCGAEAYA